MELGKDTYVNGQKIYELKDNQLTDRKSVV